jgi:hypothetical protein
MPIYWKPSYSYGTSVQWVPTPFFHSSPWFCNSNEDTFNGLSHNYQHRKKRTGRCRFIQIVRVCAFCLQELGKLNKN